jgi:RHS repeat-associated protein
MGFALEGLSTIARCPSNVAQDGRIRGVRNDAEDNFCLDGLRLVQVTTGTGRSAYGAAYDEYRTFPDTMRRVRAYPAGSPSGPQLFVVETKAGRTLYYGDQVPGQVNGRVMGKSGLVRAWWVTREEDRHDNAIKYTYRNDQGLSDMHTVTHVPKQIDYTDHPSAAASRQVLFDWTDGDLHTTAYTGGMAISRRPHIFAIRMLADGATVLGYKFTWGGGSTQRERIFRIEECAQNDLNQCRPATQLGWQEHDPGLTAIDTGIAYPTPEQDPSFTWMMADVTGDGLDDLVNAKQFFGVTTWTVATNLGGSLGDPVGWDVRAEGKVVEDNSGFPAWFEGYTGFNVVPVDLDQDGRTDLLYNDPWGGPVSWKQSMGTSFAHHAGGTALDLGEPTIELNQPGAVLYADIDGDGVLDAIVCNNTAPLKINGHPTGEWQLKLWKKDVPGYGPSENIPIDDFRGCYLANYIQVVDTDRDGKAELLVPPLGYPREEANGQSSPQCAGVCSYEALQRDQILPGNVTAWSSRATNLPAPDWSASTARVLFADVNGDGLPDAIMANALGNLLPHRLWTYLNTGDGFEPAGLLSLGPAWVGKVQDDYLDFAATLDYNGDGQTDVLLPMKDAGCPLGLDRCWVVLQASPFGDGRLDVQKTNIVFSGEIDQLNSLDYSYRKRKQTMIPRAVDVNGDGRQDVVLPSFGTFKLYISQGKLDLLTTVTDGMNPLSPGDGFQVPPDDGFMPNLEIEYGTLIDHTTTVGLDPASPAAEGELYLPRTDAANDCDYPRMCVIGPQTVVATYKLNNGENQEHDFDLHYRDGRAHRLGRGFLGFGKVLTIDRQTNAGRAELYDNVTEDNTTISNTADPSNTFGIDMFPYAHQVSQSWSWVPDLIYGSVSSVARMRFVDRDPASRVVVPTNNGKTYFTLALTTHTRELEADYPAAGKPPTVLGEVQFHAKDTNTPANLLDTTETIDGNVGYDAYGNILKETFDTQDVDDHREIDRTVPIDETDWLLGDVTEETTCSTGIVNGFPQTQCRETDRVYDSNGKGDVFSETVGDPADPQPQTTTTYTRDGFGNVTYFVAYDHLYGHQREACVGYGADGLFPYVFGNAAGHFVYSAYDHQLGAPIAEMDPNGLVTHWRYDVFGRRIHESQPDGSETFFKLARSKNSQGWLALRLEELSPEWGDRGAELDGAGRAVRSWSRGPVDPGVTICGDSGACSGNFSVIEESTSYDLFGRVASRSKPYLKGDPSGAQFFTVYQYDKLGRILSETTPWNAVTTYSYAGNTVTATMPTTSTTPATSTTTVNDPWRRPVTITSGLTSPTTTAYVYGPFGGIWKVMPPDQLSIETHRDAFGRVFKEQDPDRGNTEVTYDGFGQVMSLEDSKHSVSYEYDAIGRTIVKTDDDGQTLWQYDDPQKGLARLSFVESPAGAVKSYTYTGAGQIQTIQLSTGPDTLTTTLGYDVNGQVSTIEYPPAFGQTFRVRREYDPYGHLLRVKDDLTNASFWELKQVNGVGQTTQEQMNGGSLLTTRAYHADKSALKHVVTTAGAVTVQDLAYTYDDRLNLKSRVDALQAGPGGPLGERFTYDDLDRITCASFDTLCTPGVNCNCDLSVTYLQNGNIHTKSDVGTYKYDPAHPHAVQSTDTEAYEYDSVGNQTVRPGVDIRYTAFDLPSTYTRKADNTVVDFEYDGEQNRIRKTTPLQNTLYFGDYERVTYLASIEHHYYVRSDERVVAQVTRKSQDPPGSPGSTTYFHVDHLGSTDKVTDGAGTILERRSYDAFGAKRNPDWGSKPPSPYARKTTVGYTGHEDEEDLGLVNMKGRIYDARLGRFLMTDPLVTRPLFGQSWNPYSYVWNNPLGFTDPSGFGSIVYTGDDGSELTVNLPDDVIHPNERIPPVDQGPGGKDAGGTPERTPPEAGPVDPQGGTPVDTSGSGVKIVQGGGDHTDSPGFGRTAVKAVGAAVVGAGAVAVATAILAKELTGLTVRVGLGIADALLGPGTAAPAVAAPLAQKYSVSPDRRAHILEGDPEGSGHGPSRSQKDAFPNTWTDDYAIKAIERVANDPNSTWKQSTGPGFPTAPVSRGGPAPGSPTHNNTGSLVRFIVRGRDHGLNIQVIVEPGGEGIITGYPRK